MTKLRNKKATWIVIFMNGYYDAKNKKDAIEFMMESTEYGLSLSKSYSKFSGTAGKEIVASKEPPEDINWY